MSTSLGQDRYTRDVKYHKKGRYIKKRKFLDIDAEMTKILSDEIRAEIDRKLIESMKDVMWVS